MAILGARAAVDLVLPTGIDGSEIFRFTIFRQQKTAAQIVAEAATALGVVNQQLADEYGSIAYITDSLYGMTRQGESSRTMTPKAAEFQDSDGVKSDMIGHMLPMEWYQDALEWTERYLKNSNEQQTTGDVQLISERWKNRFDYQFISRILTNTENLIGSAGYDVGWAIGTGLNVNYIPPQWRSYIFSSSHTHYVVKNDTTSGIDYDDLIEAQVQELRHHGYLGRLVSLFSEDDLDTVTALSRFVEPTPAGLILPSGSTAPQAVGEFLGVPGTLVGYYRSKRGLVEMRFHGRIPTGYSWMTQPFGQNNASNGVAIRVDVGESFGMRPDPILTRSVNPKLEKVQFDAEFGVGVNNRLNGVAGYIAAGATTWVNPTIS